MNADHERADFLKTATAAAVKAATEKPLRPHRNPHTKPERRAVPAPDLTAGVRWMRKHVRHGAAGTHTRCTCTGCMCSRMSRFKMACHPCTMGRHARSQVRRAVRRRVEAQRVAALVRRRQDWPDPMLGLAGNHRALLAQSAKPKARRGAK